MPAGTKKKSDVKKGSCIVFIKGGSHISPRPEGKGKEEEGSNPWSFIRSKRHVEGRPCLCIKRQETNTMLKRQGGKQEK